MAFHLSFIGLAQRNNPSLQIAVAKNTDKKTLTNEAKRNMSDLSIIKTIIRDRRVRSREQDLSQGEGNPVFGEVNLLLRRVEDMDHVVSYTPLA